MATLGEPKRYRLTVPNQDKSVQDWIAEQLNISVSIRQLIREDIQKNGYTDVTCRQVEQGAKRGRPTNAELERREVQYAEPVSDIPVRAEPVSQVKQKPVQKQRMVEPPVVSEPVTPVPEFVPKKDPLDLSMGSMPSVFPQMPQIPIEEEPVKTDLGSMLDSIVG